MVFEPGASTHEPFKHDSEVVRAYEQTVQSMIHKALSQLQNQFVETHRNDSPGKRKLCSFQNIIVSTGYMLIKYIFRKKTVVKMNQYLY